VLLRYGVVTTQCRGGEPWDTLLQGAARRIRRDLERRFPGLSRLGPGRWYLEGQTSTHIHGIGQFRALMSSAPLAARRLLPLDIEVIVQNPSQQKHKDRAERDDCVHSERLYDEDCASAPRRSRERSISCEIALQFPAQLCHAAAITPLPLAIALAIEVTMTDNQSGYVGDNGRCRTSLQLSMGAFAPMSPPPTCHRVVTNLRKEVAYVRSLIEGAEKNAAVVTKLRGVLMQDTARRPTRRRLPTIYCVTNPPE
jgi:hypothetical protein